MVFENRMLRRIFGPKRVEMVGESRRLLNEKLRNLYCSPNIIRVIKSRRMKCVKCVPRFREMKNAYKILVGKPEGINHSEDLGVFGRIILECILGK